MNIIYPQNERTSKYKVRVEQIDDKLSAKLSAK